MENSNENGINLIDLIYLLIKNISKILIAGLVMAVLAFGYTKTMVVPLYKSSAKMVIKVVNSETITTFNDVQIAVGLVNDCVEIIRSRQVMQSIIDELDLYYTPEQLLSQITISVPVDTRVLRITVTNPDPRLAKDIAQALCEQSESTVAENVGVDSINTFEKPSTPIAPSSPNVFKNTITGAFFGMFAVAAYLILMKVANNKIYNQEDVEQMLGLSVFSSIPYVDEEGALRKKNKKADKSEKGGNK